MTAPVIQTLRELDAVRAEIKGAIARHDRAYGICLALDNGLRVDFVGGEFEMWWPDGITQEPARGWRTARLLDGDDELDRCAS